MKWWTNDDLAAFYGRLIATGAEFIIIGGQAVNLWSEHYRSGEGLPAATWSALEPFASHDLDLLGGRVDAAAAAQALQVEVVLFEPKQRTSPPNSGTLYVPIDGEELVVQFLHTPFGVRREEIRATACQLSWRGHLLPVMHPLLCLEGKIECYFGLNQAGRQNLKHNRLSIACVYESIRAALQNDAQRQVLTTVERIAALAAEEYAIRLRLEQRVSVEETIPWQDLQTASARLPKLAAFLEKRRPQLELRVRTRQNAYMRRFGPPAIDQSSSA